MCIRKPHKGGDSAQQETVAIEKGGESAKKTKSVSALTHVGARPGLGRYQVSADISLMSADIPQASADIFWVSANMGGGGWHKALVLVCWQCLLASRHCVWVLSPEDPPSRCVGPPFLFPHGGGSWCPDCAVCVSSGGVSFPHLD